MKSQSFIGSQVVIVVAEIVKKICEFCYWHFSAWGVCGNKDSPKKAEMTKDDDSCEEWEEIEEKM